METHSAHVLGLGVSGQAAAHLLLTHGYKVVVSDSSSTPELERVAEELRMSGARVFLGEHVDAGHGRIDFVVISPGIPTNLSVVEDFRNRGIPIISELELGWRFCSGSCVMITASNGKTTSVKLLGRIFECTGHPTFVVGNVGLPLTAVTDETTPDSLLSIEASSFQLETIVDLRPDVAVILNITPDHLGRYDGSMDDYAHAKARMWMNQTEADWLIYNDDDPLVKELIRNASSRLFPFSTENELEYGAFLDNDEFVVRINDASGADGSGEFRLERRKLKLIGRHNSANGLAVISAALLLNVDPTAILKGVESFEGVPHRLEFVRSLNGISFWNDSKCTNCDAGRCALEAVGENIILIAGGRPKGGGFKGLRDTAADRVKRLILIGEAAGEIENDLGHLAPVDHAGDLETAVHIAYSAAVSGDSVLLSPLCASFDQFPNYVARGDLFRRLVIELD